jgi:2-polyprenyl-3-methyl-5-hydroxy-6-metoxy-1,4-benzoquinol methylase
MTVQSDQIQTEPQVACPVCGESGAVKYPALVDRLFGASGSWSLKECPSSSCGTLWLDPRPTFTDIGKIYANYYTHDDVSESSFIKHAVRALAREIAAAHYGFKSSRVPSPGQYLASATAALYPGLRDHIDLQLRYLPASLMGSGKLLDIGCGNGEALQLLKDLGWQVCGVELDPQAVAAARKRNLDVRQGTLSDAAFSDETFDVVTSAHVVEHVHDPTDFLQQSRRVLRVGGTLIVVTPNVRSRSHVKFGASWRGLEPPRHLVLFTPESLRGLAEKTGLRNVRVTTTARAVALSEIAGCKIRDSGHWKEGEWPGLRTWLHAQTKQMIETLRTEPTDIQGNELVLIATR